MLNRKVLIQAVGAGIGACLGAGGIFAASFALVTPQNPIQWPFTSRSPHPFTLSLVFSLLFGLVLGWGTWWITRKIQSRTNNASNNKA